MQDQEFLPPQKKILYNNLVKTYRKRCVENRVLSDDDCNRLLMELRRLEKEGK